MADNTVYDSVFKTMVSKTPQLLVPFVNEAFDRNYPSDTPVIRFSSEHQELQGTRIDDSVFRLNDKIYHVECQSTPDTNMVIRMIEYDFAIALEDALHSGVPYEMDFPEACVLFLRHNANTPDTLEMKVNLPTGDSFTYSAKVVKAQLFSSEEIFEKRLLILLPYYLMRYELALGDIAGDKTSTDHLIAECSDLRVQLEKFTLAEGETLLYEQLVELIIKVSDRLMETYEALRKKVRRTMGGEVLELMNERAERLEREALARGREIGIEQGRAIGIEQGIEQGIERGIEQGVEQAAERLRTAGFDEETVRIALGK